MQVHRIAVLVGHDLDFNVARVLEKFLHVNLGVAECSPCFGFGGLHRVQQGRFGMHHAHAAPATTTGGLDDDGVTNCLGCALDDDGIIG